MLGLKLIHISKIEPSLYCAILQQPLTLNSSLFVTNTSAFASNTSILLLYL